MTIDKLVGRYFFLKNLRTQTKTREKNSGWTLYQYFRKISAKLYFQKSNRYVCYVKFLKCLHNTLKMAKGKSE